MKKKKEHPNSQVGERQRPWRPMLWWTKSGLYLDAEHLEDLVRCGAWDDAERYLGGFAAEADGDESPCSASRIFFAIRRQKYTEALDRRIRTEEGEILVNDLKALAPFDEEAAKMVAALENFRQHERVDTASGRNAVALEVRKLIEANPLFQDKLDFPSVEASRLRALINQSLNWQHSLCKKPKQIPDAKTLFGDHSCDSRSNGARSSPPANVPLGACPGCTARCCMTHASPSLPHAAVAQEPTSLVQPPNTASRKHPRIPTSAPGIDDPMKRTRVGQPDEVLMQPPIVNAIGSVSNLSSPTAVQSEQPDRILPTVSMAPMEDLVEADG